MIIKGKKTPNKKKQCYQRNIINQISVYKQFSEKDEDEDEEREKS